MQQYVLICAGRFFDVKQYKTDKIPKYRTVRMQKGANAMYV